MPLSQLTKHLTRTAGLLLVALLTLAACGGNEQAAKEAVTPPESPNPCELVAPTTIADVVGPSLPLTTGAFGLPKKTSSSCSWSFGLETNAADDVRRPQERQLHIDAETWKDDPCTEVKPTEQTTRVKVGDQAVLDLSVKGGVLTFCRDKRLAKITWWALDYQGGKTLSIPDEEYEDTLLRLGKEVLDRWADAPRVKVNESMTTRGDAPKSPEACDLVPAGTLATVGVDAETSNEFGSPALGSTECTWGLQPSGEKREPGDPFVRDLHVDIQSYGVQWGVRGSEQASTSARQFSYGWQVAADSSLGGGAVVLDDREAKAVGARGAFTVSVRFQAENVGSRDKTRDPSDEELKTWTRQVLTDVLEAMPR